VNNGIKRHLLEMHLHFLHHLVREAQGANHTW
jgi:hypothetical protein